MMATDVSNVPPVPVEDQLIHKPLLVYMICMYTLRSLVW